LFSAAAGDLYGEWWQSKKRMELLLLKAEMNFVGDFYSPRRSAAESCGV
jgi:hypothetical protein